MLFYTEFEAYLKKKKFDPRDLGRHMAFIKLLPKINIIFGFILDKKVNFFS